MTSQEFVLQFYPTARAHNTQSCYGESNKHKYTYITTKNKIGMEVHLADGESESNAWVNAKKIIKDNQKQKL